MRTMFDLCDEMNDYSLDGSLSVVRRYLKDRVIGNIPEQFLPSPI